MRVHIVLMPGLVLLPENCAKNNPCRHGRVLCFGRTTGDPQLRGKPVIVAWRASRSVVCAASYEARSFGIRSAMATVQAQRLCPEATFVPPDFPRYRAVSRMVRDIFKTSYGPNRAPIVGRSLPGCYRE